jgi:hypothetical protein
MDQCSAYEFNLGDTKSRIGYIIMPPGHGKSHHHCRLPGLIEADSIFNCKGTSELKELRSEAKRTNDWRVYDHHWVSELYKGLGSTRYVVMVPVKNVGEEMNATYLGSLRLIDKQWNKNLRKRGKAVKDYLYCLNNDDEYELCRTNDELEATLLGIAVDWLHYDNKALTTEN